MNAPHLTPAERLIMAALRLKPSMTADELATECLLNRQYILRLLRVLVLTAAVTRSTDGGYTLTPPTPVVIEQPKALEHVTTGGSL